MKQGTTNKLLQVGCNQLHMFKGIKTSKQYHDSLIERVTWHAPADLEFNIRLDTHWNKDRAETAMLRFTNVKNKAEVEAALKAIAENRTHERWVAEIVAFCRHGKTRYILDTTPQPPLIIDCSSFIEI